MAGMCIVIYSKLCFVLYTPPSTLTPLIVTSTATLFLHSKISKFPKHPKRKKTLIFFKEGTRGANFEGVRGAAAAVVTPNVR